MKKIIFNKKTQNISCQCPFSAVVLPNGQVIMNECGEWCPHFRFEAGNYVDPKRQVGVDLIEDYDRAILTCSGKDDVLICEVNQ